MKSNVNEEYLNYLMNDLGLLSDYDLHEIGITYEEYYNPNSDTLKKIEDYKDKKSRN